jgi:DNA-binding response OmpR family regulator
MASVRVLVTEDDKRLVDVLARGLADAGHDVQPRGDGPGGLAAATIGDYEAIVLDWMLPGRDGPSICHAGPTPQTESMALACEHPDGGTTVTMLLPRAPGRV